MVKNKGLEYWFKDDPMTHWTKVAECHQGGFFDYLNNIVKTDMVKVEKAKKAG